MDVLKQELEKSLQLYEQCRTELRNTVDQLDASQVQIDTHDAQIDELKKRKAELEKTLEDNESYCY
jgi:chromosome segregation ATPase